MLFAQEVLGVKPWSKQAEVLRAIVANRRVAVKSGNGLGKTAVAAMAVLWFLSCHAPAIVLSTAPTYRQVRNLLWREIRRFYVLAPFNLGGEMLDVRWELSEARYAMGLSADSADEFQGFHSPNLFVVVDEAAGVEEIIYEAVESVMTSENCRLLLIGNPTSMAGAFRRAFFEERAHYSVVTISAFDSPNVIEDRPVVRGLVSRSWVEERKLLWGEETGVYRARVLGEFPDQGEDTLIPLSVVEAATKRWLPLTGERVMAVDVARFGADKSVIVVRDGMQVTKILEYRALDLMALTGRVQATMEAVGLDEVIIDEIGVGAGVVDRLKELKVKAHGVNVGIPAHDDKHFSNLRAEGYWRLRQLFLDGVVAVPADQELVGQLASMRYEFDSRGRVQIESKESMRRRGASSPDKADAMMLAYLIHSRKVVLHI